MTEPVTLPTIDLARRIASAHGCDTTQIDAALVARKRQWTEAFATTVNTTDGDTQVLDPAEAWLIGSGKQLQRFFGGRCVTCKHWHPYDRAELRGATGDCRRLHDESTDALINLVQDDQGIVLTAPQFGCVCWEEIPATDAETVRQRTEVAITVGLLPAMPTEGE